MKSNHHFVKSFQFAIPIGFRYVKVRFDIVISYPFWISFHCFYFQCFFKLKAIFTTLNLTCTHQTFFSRNFAFFAATSLSFSYHFPFSFVYSSINSLFNPLLRAYFSLLHFLRVPSFIFLHFCLGLTHFHCFLIHMANAENSWFIDLLP